MNENQGLKLLSDVRQKFEPLKPAEEKLFNSFDNVCLMSTCMTIDYTNCCEAEKVLRAELLAWICSDLEYQQQLSTQGLKIIGADIVGKLNLKFAEVNIPLYFDKCIFAEKLLLQQSKLRGLALTDSRITSLNATQMNVQGNVSLNSTFEGGVNLQGATIAGALICSGLFKNPRGAALIADGINVQGDVFLNSTFEGGVNLQGATITGVLNCENGQFKNPQGTALLAEEINVGRSVLLRNSFSAEGEVRLLGAKIGGDLDCNRGKFTNSGRIALFARAVDVQRDIFMGNQFDAKGEVRLLKAMIGGNLNCEGGKFINPQGKALASDGMSVQGSVFLRKKKPCSKDSDDAGNVFCAEGEVSLLKATIGGTLDCEGGNFINPQDTALLADGINVNRDVLLRNEFRAEGEVRLLKATIGDTLDCKSGEFTDATLNLAFAKIQNLKLGEISSWPQKGKLYLNGLIYDFISLDANDVAQQNNNKKNWFKKSEIIELYWLKQQLCSLKRKTDTTELTKIHHFFPQPYEQLAKVLKANGEEDKAIQVLIAKEDDRRKYDGLKRLGKVWNLFLGVSIGHGYQPGRAVWAALFLFLVGGCFFWYGDSQDLMLPATDSFISKASISEVCQPTSSLRQNKEIDGCPNYPKFNPFFYSLDVLLPVVDLHLESYWIPNTSWLRYYLWFQILMGWILTSLIVAAFSGLVRSSN